MQRDPLYTQIISGLSQSLDSELFEQCAADLLRSDYPKLVPVCGGGDSGFDGAIADSQGEPAPLIVTTAEDAIRNLTRNLKRYNEQDGKRRWTVFVTSRRLTPRKRGNLFVRANELGFVLEQVYDQEAIANLLYDSPRWCKELLGLSGSPSALSHIPKTARLPIPGQRLIGRDNEFKWLLRTEGDKLIVGQPGSGKTCILYQLAAQDRGLFVVSEEKTAVANAIREERPPAVFVDDAGGKLELIADLVHLRRTTCAEFSIVAACWPGDSDHVSQKLDLGQVRPRDLPLLTRDEIVAVVKQAGLAGPNDLVRYIVDQAVGLPGLAIMLARFYLQEVVGEVLPGDILKRHFLQFMKPKLKEDAEAILAGFSVGGESGIEMDTVARALGFSLPEVRKTLIRLATGGVIVDSPHVQSSYSFSNARAVAVQPATLRHALVRDVFFGKSVPLPKRILDQLIDQAHSSADVAETLMGASVCGGDVPEALLQGVVEKAGDGETYRRYVSIGPRQALWALQQHPESLLVVGEHALSSAPVEVIPLLLEAAITKRQLLHQGDSEPMHFIKRWALSGKPGTGEALNRRRIVLEAAIRWLIKGGDVDVAVCAACIAVSPAYEAFTTDPGAGNTLITSSGLLAPYEIRHLRSLWTEFLTVITGRDDFSWDSIFRVLHSWAYPSSLLPSSEEEIHAETRHAIAEVAVAVVGALSKMAQGKSAVLQRLKGYIDVTGAEVDLQINEVMTLFCPDTNGQDWRAAPRSRERKLSELANKWHTRPPEQVVTELTDIAQEASQAGFQTHVYMKKFYEKLSRLVENSVPWCWALICQNANADYVAPFLQLAVANNVTGWPEVAFTCLERVGFQGLAVRLALEEPDLDSELFSSAFALVTHFTAHVEDLCMRGLVPMSVLRLMLEHEDRGVAIGAARGEWRSEPNGRVRESIAEAWRVAVIRHGTNEWFIAQAFKLDSGLAESWLLAKMQDDPGSYYSLNPRNTDGTLSVAVQVQNANSQTSLLSKLAEHTTRQQQSILWYRDLTALIVGDIPALQRQLLEDVRLKEYHLAPLRRHTREGKHLVFDSSWERFALLAFEAGYTAEQIFAATCPRLFSWSGPLSALYAIWADDFKELFLHEKHVIRQVGELGRQWAIETRESLVEEERLESVLGRR